MMSHVSHTLTAAGKCHAQWRAPLPEPETLAHRLPCTSLPAALGPEQSPRTWCMLGTSLLPDNAWCALQSLILQYGAPWYQFNVLHTSLLPDNAWCASQSLILQEGGAWHQFIVYASHLCGRDRPCTGHNLMVAGILVQILSRLRPYPNATHLQRWMQHAEEALSPLVTMFSGGRL